MGIVTQPDYKEGLSQNLSSVIASGTKINWMVWAASGKAVNNDIIQFNRNGHA